jgi:hypothetical protein
MARVRRNFRRHQRRRHPVWPRFARFSCHQPDRIRNSRVGVSPRRHYTGTAHTAPTSTPRIQELYSQSRRHSSYDQSTRPFDTTGGVIEAVESQSRNRIHTRLSGRIVTDLEPWRRTWCNERFKSDLDSPKRRQCHRRSTSSLRDHRAGL